jgi:hypothetical protein
MQTGDIHRARMAPSSHRNAATMVIPRDSAALRVSDTPRESVQAPENEPAGATTPISECELAMRTVSKRTPRSRLSGRIRPKDANILEECQGSWLAPFDRFGRRRTRTDDLRIMRCGFRWAATRIQSLTVGTGHLNRESGLSFGT